MITKEQLHKIYLEELTHIDKTHGGAIKNKHPERWDFEYDRFERTCILEECIIKPDVNIWLWSDQHFNHKNIIRYSNRPYEDLEDMNEQLVANHNNVVKQDDIVIWGGDIGFGNVNKINWYLDRCNGYKIHVLGNHDMYRNGKLYELNVDEVHPHLLLDVQDKQLLITHYPIDELPDNCYGIHGHIHTHLPFTDRHFNISVEQIEYTPINITTILKQFDML